MAYAVTRDKDKDGKPLAGYVVKDSRGVVQFRSLRRINCTDFVRINQPTEKAAS